MAAVGGKALLQFATVSKQNPSRDWNSEGHSLTSEGTGGTVHLERLLLQNSTRGSLLVTCDIKLLSSLVSPMVDEMLTEKHS